MTARLVAIPGSVGSSCHSSRWHRNSRANLRGRTTHGEGVDEGVASVGRVPKAPHLPGSQLTGVTRALFLRGGKKRRWRGEFSALQRIQSSGALFLKLTGGAGLVLWRRTFVFVVLAQRKSLSPLCHVSYYMLL